MSFDHDDDVRLKEQALRIRKRVLDMCHTTGSGHIGSSFSSVEIITALYFKCMRIFPRMREDRLRDRLILSKGHGCPTLYAALCERGLLPESILEGFSKDGGFLEQHPTRNPVYGIEVSSGSLGHGLSIGAGMALSAGINSEGHRVFVILSDGEINEGSIWEAAMFAAHHRLENLVAIVDYNKIQALGKTADIIGLDPFSLKWEALGWEVREVDGHDFSQLVPTLEQVPFLSERPSLIVAHTVKGKGVSFMENQLLWHYRCPDEGEYKRATCELCS